MIVEKGKNEKEVLRLFQEYMKKYGPFYKESLRKYINDNFLEYLYEPSAPDILMQVYGAIGVEPKIGSFYNAHISKVQELFGLNGNILEIGGGRYPAFAKKVAIYQQQTKKGSITVYDPLLITTKSEFKNLTLYKEEFTEDKDIHSYDLITGLLPCEATQAIISSACKAQKDFYVAMCGCTHFDFFNPFCPPSPYMYQKYMIKLTKDLLEQYDNGELIIEYLPEEYDIEYPILYNRKK